MRIYITTKLDLQIYKSWTPRIAWEEFQRETKLTDGSWNPSKMAKMKIDAILEYPH